MEVENGPIAYKTSFLHKRAIFHFHDYGRKGSGRIRQWSLLVTNHKQDTIIRDISFKFTIHFHCLISPKWVIYYSEPSTPTILNPKKKIPARPSELHSQLFSSAPFVQPYAQYGQLEKSVQTNGEAIWADFLPKMGRLGSEKNYFFNWKDF